MELQDGEGEALALLEQTIRWVSCHSIDRCAVTSGRIILVRRVGDRLAVVRTELLDRIPNRVRQGRARLALEYGFGADCVTLGLDGERLDVPCGSPNPDRLPQHCIDESIADRPAPRGSARLSSMRDVLAELEGL